MRVVVLVVLTGWFGLICGCVKVHFEPETKQQQTDASVVQSKDMRGQWAERLRAATTGGRLRMTKSLVDSVVSQYLKFGDQVAERWRAGNQSQPQPMTDTDVRAMIAKGTETQQPMFKAYEDMFEYSLEEMKLSREVDDSTIALMAKHGDYLYETYSAVFFPTGTVEQYEEKLYQLGRQGNDLRDELERSMQVYR